MLWRLTLLTLGVACAGARAQAPELQNGLIGLSTAHGAGTPGTTDKVVLENMRVTFRRVVSFGAGRFGWSSAESIYNVTYRFDPATLHLAPETYTLVSGSGGTGGGTGGGCANLSVQVVSSLQGSAAPIAGATIAIQSRTAQTDATGVASVTGLPPGQSLLTISANGFGTITQAAQLSCDAPNELAVALSPGAGTAGGLAPGEFRVVLTWGRDPADLDSHLTGPEAGSTSRFHVYYANRDAGTCGLDVDDTLSYGPETVTCPRTGSTGAAVVPGAYRYSVHHYYGTGNIGTSGAIVRLEQGDGSTQYFFPPASGWAGNNLWSVFELTVPSTGSTSVATLNTISNVASESNIESVPNGAALRSARAAAQQPFSVDFGSSRLAGSGQNNLLVENVRVTQGGQEVGYNVVFRLDPLTLHLVPEVISQSAGVGASNCAAVNVIVYNTATGTTARIPGATVTIGSRSLVTGATGVAGFSGATEGAASVLVTAPGYASATQSASLSCTGTNAVEVGLSSGR
ncbi:MAG: hypothetical protein JWQ07_2673 [Ramlibacter sp.]|nr:hypothetical protein [Ramlibacter sp.]